MRWLARSTRVHDSPPGPSSWTWALLLLVILLAALLDLIGGYRLL